MQPNSNITAKHVLRRIGKALTYTLQRGTGREGKVHEFILIFWILFHTFSVFRISHLPGTGLSIDQTSWAVPRLTTIKAPADRHTTVRDINLNIPSSWLPQCMMNHWTGTAQCPCCRLYDAPRSHWMPAPQVSAIMKKTTTRNVGQCPTWWSPCQT